MAVLTQLSHCVVALHRLSTFEHNEWDLTSARATLDFSYVLAQVISKLSQVRVVMLLDHATSEEKDIFVCIAKTLGSIKIWWDTKLAAESTSRADDTILDIPMDWLDDAWFQDVLETNQYSFEPIA